MAKANYITDRDATLLRELFARVKRLEGRRGPGQSRYRVAADSSTPMVLFLVTGNESGGGKYTAKSITMGATVSLASDLSPADLGEVSATVDVSAWNLQEMSQSTHDIGTDVSQTYFYGIDTGMVTDESSPRRVVLFDSAQWDYC